jgi:Cys-rich repeat protein
LTPFCEGGSCRGCDTNAECAQIGNGNDRCDMVAHRCVECLAMADCPANQMCDTRDPPLRVGGCNANTDCANNTVCNTTSHFCVRCLTDANCPNGQHCDVAGNACVECVLNTHCNKRRGLRSGARMRRRLPGQQRLRRGGVDFCDLATMSCVECRTNADCGGANTCLPTHTCN